MKFSDFFLKFLYLVAIFVILIVIYCGVVIFPSICIDKNLCVQYCVLLVMVIGSIFGFYKYYQIKSEYLDLRVKTKYENNIYSIKTQVYNESGVKKNIEYAFILITRQEINILDAINEYIHTIDQDINISYTDDLKILKKYVKTHKFANNNMCIIPLRFYYIENIQIGNESPSYTYSFENSVLNLETGIYSVRFFIYQKKGLHRSTVDSLIIT